jgi:flagellar biosynthetic protein FlhB
MADANKTEKGTPRRREKAREKGQVVRSREIPSAVAVLAATIVLAIEAAGWMGQWRAYWMRMMDVVLSSADNMPLVLTKLTIQITLLWLGPVLAAGWLAAVAASFAQGDLVIVPGNLFRWERLSPAGNLKNIFSPAGLGRMAQSFLPGGVIVWLMIGIFARNWTTLVHSIAMPIGRSLPWMLGLLYEISWKSGMVLLIWSGVDYYLQRRTYEKNLRMSKQDIKDEGKETEGSPEIKGRIRRTMRQAHRKRMMQNVPQANVIITNPTEYAVALKYQPMEMPAPVVVAKGRNLLAREIRRIARQSGIPIVENVPLAQALYRSVEVDHPIPSQLYAAVAEILAFIYRTQRNMPVRPPAQN